MNVKRILSVLLTACMLLCAVPLTALPVFADGPSGYDPDDPGNPDEPQTDDHVWPDPYYLIDEYRPELALFNYWTGNSKDYYTSVMKSSNYNAVAAGYFKESNKEDPKTLKYDSKLSGALDLYSWEGFRSTNLAKISDRYDQLKAGLGVTMNNKDHKHWSGLSSYRVISYTRVYLSIMAGGMGYGAMASHSGYSKDQETLRKGEAAFKDIPADMYKDPDGDGKGRPLALESYREYVSWGDETCTCGGSSENYVVGFCDSTAPSVESVKILNNGQECTDFTKGDTITVVVTYDEPVRFADDDKRGKGDLCVGLMVANKGQGDWLYAHLVGLSGDTLVFECEIDPNETRMFSVTGIDFASAPDDGVPLVRSKADIPLKTIKGNGTITVKKPDSVSSAEGFTASRSWITDLAGNPISNEQPRAAFYVDCEAPYAYLITYYNDMGNSDIKAMRGVTDLEHDDPLYGDNSDLYMGGGDMIGFYIYMNEFVYWGRDEGTDITNGYVVTNLRYNDTGEFLKLGLCNWYMPVQASTIGAGLGLGRSYGQLCKFATWRVYIPNETYRKMTVVDPPGVEEDKKGRILITELHLENTGIKDASENFATSANWSAPGEVYKLDTTAPTFTLGDAVQTGGANGDFYIPFTITDEEGGSGVLNLPAKLWLSDPNGNTGSMQYAVSGSSEKPAAGSSLWKNGTMGCEIAFDMIGATQYLHVKPDADAHFNLSSEQNLEIKFELQDYAGNKKTTRAADVTGVLLDSVGPDVSMGEVTKSFVSGGGRLSVKLNVDDPSGISSVKYQWLDPGSDEDDLDDDSWTDAVKSGGAWTATGSVASGELFRKELWVKATDGALDGNVSIAGLGVCSFSLESIEYALDWSPAITTEAKAAVSSLESGGVLVFDVKLSGDSDHYVAYVDEETDDIFGSGVYWSVSEIESSESGYTVSGTQSAGDFLKDYTGNITVTVYSGSSDMFEETVEDEEDLLIISAGAGVETFTLKQSPAGNGASDVFAHEWYDILTPASSAEAEKLGGIVNSIPWTFDSDEHINATLAGIQLSLDLGGDKNGWGYADIDWAHSFIKYYHDGSSAPAFDDFESFLSEDDIVCAIGRGPSQIVTLPDSELFKEPTGNGHLFLILSRISSPDTPYVIEFCNYINDKVTIAVDDPVPGSIAFNFLGREINDYGDVYYEQLPFDESGMIYIPTSHKTALDVAAVYSSYDEDAEEEYTLQYKASHDGYSYLNALDIIAWRADVASPEIISLHKGVISQEGNKPWQEHWSSTLASFSERMLIFGEETDPDDGVIGVEADEDNLIALQVVFANGETSEVQYITVHPVTLDPKGTISIENSEGLDLGGPASLATTDPGDASIVFTPASGFSTRDIQFKAYIGAVDGDGVPFIYDEDHPLYMSAAGDGSFKAKVPKSNFWAHGDPELYDQQFSGMNYGIYRPNYVSGYSWWGFSNQLWLPGGMGYYLVYAEDGYGNEVFAGVTDWDVIADGTPPLFDDNFLDLGDNMRVEADGSFTATFRIEDESLYSYDSENGEFLPRPMTLELFYDTKYCEAAGIAPSRLVLEGVGDGFVWKDDGGNDMGICEVTAELFSDTVYIDGGMDEYQTYDGGFNEVYLTVTVKGIVSPNITSPTDMVLYAAATDAHGNSTGWKMPDPSDPDYDLTSIGYYLSQYNNPGGAFAEGVVGVKPKAVSYVYKETDDGEPGDRALFITFNAPVKPVESWIRIHGEEIEGYRTEWHDAFPIFKDGTWQIEYTDAFGNLYTQEIVLDGVIGEYGIDLSFSTLDWVSPETGVTVTAAADDDDETLSGEVVYSEGDAPQSVSELAATFNENVYEYEIIREKGGNKDRLHIQINNIVDGAPEETLFFYFEEYGDMYKAGTHPTGTTTGKVIVSYKTDRETSPVGDTRLTFREGDDDAYSFQYYDAATDKKYTLAGSLYDDHGIILGHYEPYRDEEAPSVDLVTVWKQRAGGFVQMEAFPGGAQEADITKAIKNSGTAQSYDFVVNASDYSRWKVFVKSSLPGSMSFDGDPADDVIKGVSVQGNNVLVTSDVEADFYIVVVDAASVDTPADADNFTAVKIPFAAYHFDNVAPEIETLTQAMDMYSKVIYIKVRDEDNDGNETTGVTVSGKGILDNSDPGFEEYQYKLLFFDNDAVPFTATDAAGNSRIRTIEVEGIDVSTPDLTVTWSPCFRDDAEGLQRTNPTAGPVNTNVIATIDSDKYIFRVSANDGSELVFDGSVALAPWGKVEYNSDRVTVTVMTGSELDLTVTVTAPNKKSADANIKLGAGVIDKDAPVVNDTVTQMKRDGFSVPYAEKHSLSFNEEVFCMNEGPAGAVYSDVQPLEITLNGMTQPRALYFNDRAGNVTAFDLRMSGGVLDDQAPSIEIELDDDQDATNSRVPVTVVSDEFVTLTASDSSVDCGRMTEAADGSWTGTVSAGENGTFRITAADAAGNTASAVFTVNNIDKTLPLMAFDKSSIGVIEGSDLAALRTMLENGVTVWDNVGIREGSLSFDISAVDLSLPGVYEVIYNVEDLAGNVGENSRYVKVIDKDLPMLVVDGETTEENGTTVVEGGAHKLTVSGLKDAAEPYTILVVKGLYSRGQMKVFHEGLDIGEDGSVQLTQKGFYTVLLTTQSRQTYRTLLYVEPAEQ